MTPSGYGLLEQLEEMSSDVSIPYGDHCEILSDWFGAFVQFMLAVMAFSSLLIKLYFESPRRPFKIWVFDASKQGISGLVAHCQNMLFSVVLVAGSAEGESQCVYYFISFLFDSVLGCILNFSLILVIDKLALHYGWSSLLSGFYGKPPSVKIWSIQLLEWIVIVVVVKFFMYYAIIIPLQGQLYAAGEFMLKPVQNYPRFELMLVMIIIPFILNTITFWVTDSVIMDTSTPRDPLRPNEDLFNPRNNNDNNKNNSNNDDNNSAGQLTDDDDKKITISKNTKGTEAQIEEGLVAPLLASVSNSSPDSSSTSSSTSNNKIE